MASQPTSEQSYWLNQLAARSSEYIIGVDECGYGSWAGPVVVCAAVVHRDWSHPAVKDSKKVAKALSRMIIVRDILKPPNVLFSLVLEGPPRVIDAIGLGRVRDECAVDAMEVCLAKFPGASIVMDGNHAPTGSPAGVICIVEGDALVPAVSAASLIGKVHHDEYMYKQHDIYPHYGWETNVGYGTDEHEAGLKQHGITPLHRKSIKRVNQYARRV